MPILKYDPGAAPEAPGTLYFYEQGADPSTGLQVSSKGEITAPNSTGAVFPPGEMQPVDHGFQEWAFDPVISASGALAANGSVYLSRLPVRKAMTITSLWWSVVTSGASPVAGQNWVGLYDSTGTRLVQAGVDASISSTGPKQTTVTATALSPGYVWVAFLFNGATAPTLARGSTFETTPNAGLATAALRFALNGTGRTTLATSITPASNTTNNAFTYWSALS
jgi:hypothetical protein